MVVLAVVAVFLSIFLIGCAKSATQSVSESTSVQEAEITDDISDIENIDTDMDIAELDSLDKEFADLEAMFS